MRNFFIILLLIFTVTTANAQHKTIDTLRVALSKATVDTVRLNILMQLGTNYFIPNPDSSIIFGLQAYDLAGKYKLPLKQAKVLNNMANAYSTMGDYVKGIQMYFKALRVNESFNNIPGIVTVYNNIGATYVQEADYKNALRYLQLGDKLWEPYILSHKLKKINERRQKAVLFINFGECYLYTNRIDSADYYLQLAYRDAKNNNFANLTNNIDRDLGEVEIARGHKATALKYLREAVTISKSNDDGEMLSMSYLSTAKLFRNNKQQDSAEYYAKQALESARGGNYEQDVLNAGKVLYSYYDEDHNLLEAYKYYKLTTAAKDSLYSQDKVKQLLSMEFEEKQRRQDIAVAESLYQEKVRSYVLLGGLVILLLLAFIFWRNSKQRKAANQLLQKQKEDIESALAKLQLTQNQLIQSEKMASLGELTAGIAHEIQNPLNFVNNFSEVNSELIDEMQLEIDNGHFEDVKALAVNVKENQQKISQHGKRADFIVKGMLQHSRTNTGERQPTNINLLADEFFKLSYHGLRAKDKSFNTEMVVNFDPDLPKVNVVQQEIGRVLLNLFNNAFYAVNQKAKTAGIDYKAEVTLTTYTENGNVIIKVKDNGVGIPDHIRDKIMQPFFTTKPTGEGTGLGLSLSYDIVVKGHSGKIDVKSKLGEYTEFTISLPADQINYSNN
jgi:two-component system NtrC family sensor kinase